jgi:hypothetical protein
MHCHVSYNFRPHLPAEVGSRAATCPTAPDLTSLLRWAPALPRASPPCWVELRRCHMFLSFGARLSTKVGSDAATCLMAPGSASSRGELRHCNMFLSSGPRLPAEVGSDAATWHWPRLLERRAPVLPRTPWPQRAVNHMNKERSSYPRHATRLACIQSTTACYRDACKTCGQTGTVQFNSATQVQLTTLRHGYSGDTTRQDGTTALTIFSIAGWGDMTTPRCWCHTRHH